MLPKWVLLGRTPLTDVRSILGSAVFHGFLLILASLVVLSAILPGPPGGPPGLLGAVDQPVDNRADVMGPGGGPGEMGGTLRPDDPSLASSNSPATGSAPSAVATDHMADALIDDILAVPSMNPTSADRPTTDLPTLPRPAGVGVVPGPGSGGGGGQGGGSGGGTGLGIGAGTEFFGAKERAASFAYVIDCSASMTNRNSIGIAKRELLASLRRLPPDAHFGVIFYNEKPTPFLDASGQPRLMVANTQNKARFEDRLAHVGPDGGTDHFDALLAAFAMKPEVVFFLTDADLMTDREAAELARQAGPIRIQAVEFGVGPDSGSSVPLRNLATETGGMYRYIDVMTFPGRMASD